MLKRAFDVLASAAGLIVLAPLLLAIAAAIKLGSPGPVFYHGVRVGKGGAPIRVRKFRSMVANAAQRGPGITAAGDPRITRVGRLLRRTKLDELPQLLNVLEGTMSIVGPRPEDPRYVALYTPDQRRALDVRPGITSPASVRFRNEEQALDRPDWETHYVQHVMPEKLAIDLEYVARASLLTDLGILARTFIALFR
ncbi:MAG: sugar transferase [Anaerolineae bacterium]|nr:sugar transferase [Anaerolineae bacterium]